MTEKTVKFRIELDDQATAKMQEIKAQMDALQSSTQKITASTGMSPPSVSPTTSGSKAGFDPESGFKWGASDNISDYRAAVQRNMDERAAMAQKQKQTTSKKTPAEPGKQMVSEEWARPLRAVGAYRTAWFAGQDTSAGPMKAAAGIFILQAVADGIKKIVEILSQASPALKAEIKILNVAMNEMIRPIGDLLGTVLRPVSRAMLQANAYARSSMAEEGIPQTDLSEYYARFGVGLGAIATGTELFGENAEDLSERITILKGLMDIWASANILGAALKISETLPKVADWFEDNSGLFPIWTDALSGTLNTVVALKDPMSNLTNTVVKLDEAMTNFYPIIETVTDAMSGVGNVLGGLGDAGKGAGDFFGGLWEEISGYRR